MNLCLFRKQKNSIFIKNFKKKRFQHTTLFYNTKKIQNITSFTFEGIKRKEIRWPINNINSVHNTEIKTGIETEKQPIQSGKKNQSVHDYLLSRLLYGSTGTLNLLSPSLQNKPLQGSVSKIEGSVYGMERKKNVLNCSGVPYGWESTKLIEDVIRIEDLTTSNLKQFNINSTLAKQPFGENSEGQRVKVEGFLRQSSKGRRGGFTGSQKVGVLSREKEKLKKENFPFNQYFFPYQKSFLCYWLLPFVGFIFTTNQTYLISDSPFILFRSPSQREGISVAGRSSLPLSPSLFGENGIRGIFAEEKRNLKQPLPFVSFPTVGRQANGFASFPFSWHSERDQSEKGSKVLGGFKENLNYAVDEHTLDVMNMNQLKKATQNWLNLYSTNFNPEMDPVSTGALHENQIQNKLKLYSTLYFQSLENYIQSWGSVAVKQPLRFTERENLVKFVACPLGGIVTKAASPKKPLLLKSPASQSHFRNQRVAWSCYATESEKNQNQSVYTKQARFSFSPLLYSQFSPLETPICLVPLLQTTGDWINKIENETSFSYGYTNVSPSFCFLKTSFLVENYTKKLLLNIPCSKGEEPISHDFPRVVLKFNTTIDSNQQKGNGLQLLKKISLLKKWPQFFTTQSTWSNSFLLIPRGERGKQIEKQVPNQTALLPVSAFPLSPAKEGENNEGQRVASSDEGLLGQAKGNGVKLSKQQLYKLLFYSFTQFNFDSHKIEKKASVEFDNSEKQLNSPEKVENVSLSKKIKTYYPILITSPGWLVSVSSVDYGLNTKTNKTNKINQTHQTHNEKEKSKSSFSDGNKAKETDIKVFANRKAIGFSSLPLSFPSLAISGNSNLWEETVNQKNHTATLPFEDQKGKEVKWWTEKTKVLYNRSKKFHMNVSQKKGLSKFSPKGTTSLEEKWNFNEYTNYSTFVKSYNHKLKALFLINQLAVNENSSLSLAKKSYREEGLALQGIKKEETVSFGGLGKKTVALKQPLKKTQGLFRNRGEKMEKLLRTYFSIKNKGAETPGSSLQKQMHKQEKGINVFKRFSFQRKMHVYDKIKQQIVNMYSSSSKNAPSFYLNQTSLPEASSSSAFALPTPLSPKGVGGCFAGKGKNSYNLVVGRERQNENLKKYDKYVEFLLKGKCYTPRLLMKNRLFILNGKYDPFLNKAVPSVAAPLHFEEGGINEVTPLGIGEVSPSFPGEWEASPFSLSLQKEAGFGKANRKQVLSKFITPSVSGKAGLLSIREEFEDQNVGIEKMNSAFPKSEEQVKILVEQQLKQQTSNESNQMVGFSSLPKGMSVSIEGNQWNTEETRRKYVQKKRRRKKLKKETRRRKKRKRFYPRPTWLRYQLFLKLLNKRKTSVLPSTGESIKSSLFSLPIISSSLGASPSGNTGNKGIQKLADTMKVNPLRGRVGSNSTNNSFDWPKKQTPANELIYSKKHKKPLSFSMHTTKKENFVISSSVLRDFKKLLWKSYWLRSNLNPYLKRVQTFLTDMKKSTQKWEFFSNFNILLNYVGGFSSSLSHSKEERLSSLNSLSSAKQPSTPLGESVVSRVIWPGKEKGIREMNKMPSFAEPEVLPALWGAGKKEEKAMKVKLSHNFNEWENTLYFAEYNRITYHRIQELISQIRENFATLSFLNNVSSFPNGHKEKGHLTSPSFSGVGVPFRKESSDQAVSLSVTNPEAVKSSEELASLSYPTGASVGEEGLGFNPLSVTPKRGYEKGVGDKGNFKEVERVSSFPDGINQREEQTVETRSQNMTSMPLSKQNLCLKVRSSHLSHSKFQYNKREYILSKRKVTDFWVKLGKAIMAENQSASSVPIKQTYFNIHRESWLLPNSVQKAIPSVSKQIAASLGLSIPYDKPTIPQLRILWALSKTTPSLYGALESGSDGLVNRDVNQNSKINISSYLRKRQKTWVEAGKFREQTKYNKTKKMVRDLSMKLETLLNEQYGLITQLLPFQPRFDSFFANSDSQAVKVDQKDQSDKKSLIFTKEKERLGANQLFFKLFQKIRQKEDKINFAVGDSSPSRYSLPSPRAAGFVNIPAVRDSSLFALSTVPTTKVDTINEVHALFSPKGTTSLFSTKKAKGTTDEIWLNNLTSKSSYWWVSQETKNLFSFSHQNQKQNLPPLPPGALASAEKATFFYESETKIQQPLFQTQTNPSHNFPDHLTAVEAAVSFSSSRGTNGVQTWVCALLFHFCSILSLISISQIRGLLKFYLLSISKIFKISVAILQYSYDYASRFHIVKLASPYKQNKVTPLSFSSSPLIPDGKTPSFQFPSTFPSSSAEWEKKIAKETLSGLVGNLSNAKNKQSVPFGKKISYPQRLFGKTHQNGANKNQKTHLCFLALKLKGLKAKDQSMSNIQIDNQKLLSNKQEAANMNSLYKQLNQERRTQINTNNSIKFFNLPLFQGMNVLGFAPQRADKSSIATTQFDRLYNEGELTSLGGQVKIESYKGKKHYVTLYSLILLNHLMNRFYNFSLTTKLILKQIFNTMGRFGPKSILNFLEKPGELIIDWIAYMFLVEWSSDITNTIPENVDIYLGTSYYKLTRTVYSFNFIQMFYHLFPFAPQRAGNNSFPLSALGGETILNLGSMFIQHRIYHLYEILLFQFYQPDTDLIVRQKKGTIFWDIWGDFLMQVAEDSNVNISELTSLKEEQIQLLEKCSSFPSAQSKPLQGSGHLGSSTLVKSISGGTFSSGKFHKEKQNRHSWLLEEPTYVTTFSGGKKGQNQTFPLLNFEPFKSKATNMDRLFMWKSSFSSVITPFSLRPSQQSSTSLPPSLTKPSFMENGEGYRGIAFNPLSLGEAAPKGGFFAEKGVGGKSKAEYQAAPLYSEEFVSLNNTKGKAPISLVGRRDIQPFVTEKVNLLSLAVGGKRDIVPQKGSFSSLSLPKGKEGKHSFFIPDPLTPEGLGTSLNSSEGNIEKGAAENNNFAAQQFLSYQGKDTELFIDLHPPKSFSMISLLKKNESVQSSLGSLVCQIFSGIISKQISKNILIVGGNSNNSAAINNSFKHIANSFNSQLQNQHPLPSTGSGESTSGVSGEKTLLIQAIAGETELKIITDNAYRYAMVYRGVAVGIKLLRDVFDSLSLHTPCLFLIEDIHAIGERRPLLISDDEKGSSPNGKPIFGSQREEIHEKNQVLYQLSKHVISHYRKPYKGDFSLLIPTNHFCFDLFAPRSIMNSSWLSSNPQRGLEAAPSGKQLVSLHMESGEGLTLQDGSVTTPFTGVDGEQLVEKLGIENEQSRNIIERQVDLQLGKMNDLDSFNVSKINPSSLSFPSSKISLPAKGIDSSAENQSSQGSAPTQNRIGKGIYKSRLLIKSSQVFAPPATSPFSVLNLKEEKKFQPYQMISEMPWGGLPGEQLAQLSKASYSIRVKVAVLADMAISTLSVKLDMITDLLVIIDSVKGNRGFVVFATTHVPYILDPALRRPGRLDETITLGLFPNLLSRWDIFKSSFGLFIAGKEQTGFQKGVSFDLTYSITNSFIPSFNKPLPSFNKPPLLPPALVKANSLPVGAISQKKQGIVSFVSYMQHREPEKYEIRKTPSPFFFFTPSQTTLRIASPREERKEKNHKKRMKILSQTYFIASNMLYEANRNSTQNYTTNHYNANMVNSSETTHFHSAQNNTVNSQKELSPSLTPKGGCFAEKGVGRKGNFARGSSPAHNFLDLLQPLNMETSSLYVSLYASPYDFQNYLIKLMSGKLGEMFLVSSAPFSSPSQKEGINVATPSISLSQKGLGKTKDTTSLNVVDHTMHNSSSIINQNYQTLEAITWLHNHIMKGTGSPYGREKFKELTLYGSNIKQIVSNLFSFTNTYIYQNYKYNQQILTSFGLSNTWKILSSLILAFVQKRYLYTNNLIVPKFLYFNNQNSIYEPPSPPASSILLPARRYENYRRSFSYYSGRKISIGIMEKIQTHQQQRLVKRLYGFPVKELFKSQIGFFPLTPLPPKGVNTYSPSEEGSEINPSIGYQSLILHRELEEQKEKKGIKKDKSTQTDTKNTTLSVFPYTDKGKDGVLDLVNKNGVTGFTSFTNATLMIGSLSSVLQKPSNSNWFIKNRILMRHKNYLTNQWWNGQLPEHNAETTFLSDIDWRYSFVESIGDLLLDFPDADQHYNPRNRRWLLTTGYYHNWFNFEKNFYNEIYTHFIFDSFVKAYTLYEQNREVLDFYSFYVLKKGLYIRNIYSEGSEIEMITLYKRFFT